VRTTNQFIKGQAVIRSEDDNVEYKDYRFPIDPATPNGQSIMFTLKKTLCSFMNGNGGAIVLGVKENQKRTNWWVEGIKLLEHQK